MGRRKHISAKKRAAIFALALGDIPYDDAKRMTEDQILSLYHLDHNMLHSSEHEDRDAFWNYTPMLIKAHRVKTRQDTKIIAKSRRIRAWNAAVRASTLRTGPGGTATSARDALAEASRPARPLNPWATSGDKILASIRLAAKKRRLQSRGFDQRYKRKMSGKVVKREP